MKYDLTLNKIKEHLIAPRFAFTQIFQLQGYEQYGMSGNIVNVPTNLNLMQDILPRMSYDDFSIAMFLNRKLEYKSIYMLGYIFPNIVMKTL
jgi:hypothetical protein